MYESELHDLMMRLFYKNLLQVKGDNDFMVCGVCQWKTPWTHAAYDDVASVYSHIKDYHPAELILFALQE